jgi:hypothetical protein
MAFCFEADKQMADEAIHRYRRDPKVQVIWGRLVEAADVDDTNLQGDEASWLKGDLARLESSPNVLWQVPSQIDLLVLDGGEFTTQAEFQLLKSRVSGWIALDDTHTRKCRGILERVYAGEEDEFAVVDYSDERNGVALLRRIRSR